MGWLSVVSRLFVQIIGATDFSKLQGRSKSIAEITNAVRCTGLQSPPGQAIELVRPRGPNLTIDRTILEVWLGSL